MDTRQTEGPVDPKAGLEAELEVILRGLARQYEGLLRHLQDGADITGLPVCLTITATPGESEQDLQMAIGTEKSA